MTYQLKGLQISLFLHAVVITLAWGLNGSLAQSGNSVISLDFSILHGSMMPAREITHESPPERASRDVPPPAKEREASLDGKIIASIADAHSAPQKQTESISNGREGQSTDIEFGSITGPFYLHQEMPVYPTFARKLGREGRVLLRLTIDEQGKLLNVEVLEDPGFGFAEAAVKAVKRSSFIPAQRGGSRVIAKALLPVKFELKNVE